MGIFGESKCDSCSRLNDLLSILTEQLKEREKTILALVNTQASKVRFPAPRRVGQEIPSEADPMNVSDRKSVLYTAPIGDTFEDIEQQFELEAAKVQG